MGLSILVASCGRPTLQQTIASIIPQLQAGDELLVDVNGDGDYGNAARNRLMAKATGTHLMFMDDDDRYTLTAFATVRAALGTAPGRVHMFRMQYAWGPILWETEELVCGNVSTQMFVVPNISGQLAAWGDSYTSDFDFIYDTCATLGEPVWHEDEIAIIR